MVAMSGKNQSGIDFSIMPTLECNLKCSFCMYNCSPENKQQIDFEKLEKFLNTIPSGIINSFGLYGGEPSINLSLYRKVLALLPKETPKFIITNGTWTKFLGIDFIEFTIEHNLECFISSTPEHQMFQDTVILKNVLRSYQNFIVKEDDTKKRLLPMGRNATGKWHCTGRCLRDKKPLRFAIMPDGNIIFQLCDGVYPIVGCVDTPFNPKEYLKQIAGCQIRNKYEENHCRQSTL